VRWVRKPWFPKRKKNTNPTALSYQKEVYGLLSTLGGKKKNLKTDKRGLWGWREVCAQVLVVAPHQRLICENEKTKKRTPEGNIKSTQGGAVLNEGHWEKGKKNKTRIPWVKEMGAITILAGGSKD